MYWYGEDEDYQLHVCGDSSELLFLVERKWCQEKNSGMEKNHFETWEQLEAYGFVGADLNEEDCFGGKKFLQKNSVTNGKIRQFQGYLYCWETLGRGFQKK